jgi:hypothetical protein
MRPEHELRREANMRNLFDATMGADTNGQHGQSIYEIQKAAKQVEEGLRKDGFLQGPNREAALKTVVGSYISNAGFDPKYLDSDTQRSQVRFKEALYNAHEAGHLQNEVLEQAQTMTKDQQQARGGATHIPARAAAEPER